MSLRGYRHEWLLLCLIALATLPLVSVTGAQDTSRLALTESIVHRGSVDIDPFWELTTDRAFAHGHWYTDKAPGVSLLAVVPVAVANLVAPGAMKSGPSWTHGWLLWLIRIWTGGIAYLALVFLAGRIAEGLREGAGAVVAVTLGLGTMIGSLGPTMFGHVPDALLLLGAFLLATRARQARDWIWVGVLAGFGVLFEYPAAIAVLLLVLFALRKGGRVAAGATILGGIPAAATLGTYDQLAFGAPWRLSYRYTDNVFTAHQHEGLFGIGVPTPNGLWTLLVDGHGLLLVSPVLIAATAGLIVWGRTHRLEAGIAGGIAFAFALATIGYFLPNGGLSPGPRFATAAIPFLFLGLAVALERSPWVTTALAALSIGIGMFDELTWSIANRLEFLGWPKTTWSMLGLSSRLGCICLLAAATGAALLAGASLFRSGLLSTSRGSARVTAA